VILVDPRAGSENLIEPLREFGHKVKSKRMKFGDVAFQLEGHPEQCLLGIEYKKLDDLLNSLRTKRLVGHQLPGMVKTYRHFSVLLVEGIYAPDVDGRVQQLLKSRRRKGRRKGGPSGKVYGLFETYGSWQYHTLQKMLYTICFRGGVHYARTLDLRETVHWIAALYEWARKGWNKHHSHLAFDQALIIRPDQTMLMKPSQVRAFAKEIPGVGWERSRVVAKAFRYPVDMFEASKKDWLQLEGFGPVLAARAWETLHSRTKRLSKVQGVDSD
jgi:ERCC4-type nuclease